MNALVVFFAEYAGYVLLAAAAFLLLKKRKKYLLIGSEMVLAVLLSRGIITEAIRFFWHRQRPFVEKNIQPLIEHSASASFPSGHAAFFFALATIVYVYDKRLGVVLFAGATAMGVARVIAGLHWVSDIAGGATIGILSGMGIIWVSRRIWKKESSL